MPQLQTLDIGSLPSAEDERHEFKSSATSFNTLKDKLGRAASGFWNSGGGLFVVGVDGSGKPDGGVEGTVGRQALRDWVDQVLEEVSPTGTYAVRLFPHDPATGLNISANRVVLAIEFPESMRPPHMAPDNKYYIRAGAHTIPASHYLVEALWARRRVQRPQLAHAMRLKPEASDIVQLAILALTDEPAVEVSVALDPLPEMWKDANNLLPVRLPLLDRATPFYLDLTTYFQAELRVGSGVQLSVSYKDLAGNSYEYKATLDVKNSIAPWRIGTPASEKIAKSLESMEKTFQKVPLAIDKLHSENAELRVRLEVLARAAFPQRAAEPLETARKLGADAVAVLVGARSDGHIVFSRYHGGSQLHAGERQLIAPGDAPREDARWKGAISELLHLELIDGVFDRSGSSVFRLTYLGFRVVDVLKEERKGDPSADADSTEAGSIE